MTIPGSFDGYTPGMENVPEGIEKVLGGLDSVGEGTDVPGMPLGAPEKSGRHFAATAWAEEESKWLETVTSRYAQSGTETAGGIVSG